MSAYRYVVFHSGAAPSAAELATLRRFADHLNQHIAMGVHRQDGRLAIACEAEPFDRLRGLEPAFEELLSHWRSRGSEVAEKLPFVKDPKPWKALERDQQTPSKSPPPRVERPAITRRFDASEAEGRARLAAARSAAQAETLERAAHWLPYALWGLGAAAVLATGGYLGWRLLNAEGERRVDTVERVLESTFDESLTPAN